MGSCCIPFRMSRLPRQWGLLQMKATQLPITLWTLSRVFSYPFSISPQQTFPEQLCSLLFNILHSKSQVQLGPQWICYDSKASNIRWWPITPSFSLTDVRGHFRGPCRTNLADQLKWRISAGNHPGNLNMVQTMTPAQRKKGKKMVNTLKLELCNLI